MSVKLSVIIPNKNGAKTLDRCLRAVFETLPDSAEVILVDDASRDGSIEIAKDFPCRVIPLANPVGAAIARNTGACHARGEILFFIDSDCIVQKDTFTIGVKAIEKAGRGWIVGGTYRPKAEDPGFFSTFQAQFVNYFESKTLESPDYIATHLMVMYRDDFLKTGGFWNNELPILEDVEFSHRAKRLGLRLKMIKGLYVGHIFNFDLFASLKNAFKKSLYWSIYSLKNRDIYRDSGTASIELKLTSLLYIIFLSSSVLSFLWPVFLWVMGLALGLSLVINKGFYMSFYKNHGLFYMAGAVLYMSMVYPASVLMGALAGAVQFFKEPVFSIFHKKPVNFSPDTTANISDQKGLSQ